VSGRIYGHWENGVVLEEWVDSPRAAAETLKWNSFGGIAHWPNKILSTFILQVFQFAGDMVLFKNACISFIFEEDLISDFMYFPTSVF
jgi:hypothetical protein